MILKPDSMRKLRQSVPGHSLGKNYLSSVRVRLPPRLPLRTASASVQNPNAAAAYTLAESPAEQWASLAWKHPEKNWRWEESA